MLDSFTGTRPYVYCEILGQELFDQLKAKQRGRIYLYAKRHHMGEILLLQQIRSGSITIAQIEEDHLRWKDTKK